MDEVFNSKRIAPRLTNVSLRCENEGVEFQVLKALRASDRSVRALWGLDHGRADEAEAAFRAAHLRLAVGDGDRTARHVFISVGREAVPMRQAFKRNALGDGESEILD